MHNPDTHTHDTADEPQQRANLERRLRLRREKRPKDNVCILDSKQRARVFNAGERRRAMPENSQKLLSACNADESSGTRSK